MRRYEGKAAGFMGAVIIHLLVLILFYSVKLNSLKKDREKEFLIVFEEAIIPDKSEAEQTTYPAQMERLADIDQMISNIVRNLANPDNPVINPQDYQDMVKEEMIKQGLLNDDNFIDDWKSRSSDDNAIVIAEKIRDKLNSLPEEKEPPNFQGPTRVYYRLENRHHKHLPIPVYKCEGAGMVTVTIEADRSGIVNSAVIMSSETTTNDPCLLETAVKAALSAKFNDKPTAPTKQSGTITFHFVAQY